MKQKQKVRIDEPEEVRPASAPIKKTKPRKPEDEIAATTGNRPGSAPSAGAEAIRVKRGAEGGQGGGYNPRAPFAGRAPAARFIGAGNKLDPEEAFGIGPGRKGLIAGASNGFRTLGVRGSYDAFAGRSQKLDDPDLRERARRRMREIGIAAEEAQSSSAVRQMVATIGNKRDAPEPNIPRTILRKPEVAIPVRRRRMGDRNPGPQRFDIAT